MVDVISREVQGPRAMRLQHMNKMFGTRTMNFYCNDYHHHQQNPGGISNSRSSYPGRITLGAGNTRNVNSLIYNSTLRFHCCWSTLDFFTRATKTPLYIQLIFLLILLPNPGTQVLSQPQPQPQPQQSLGLLSSGEQKLPVLSRGIISSSTNSSYNISYNYNNNNSMALVKGMTILTTGATIGTTGDALTVPGDDNPFENNTYSNTTVPLGDTAFLKCTVRNLGERSVSWIRRRDMHIISVGKVPYTNDERFHVLNIEGSDDWVLQIKYVQKRDNGTYECQVSTGKGIASYAVHLFVAVPEAFILGNGEYHIQQGSTINLVCIVEKSPKPPDYIFWYHNERMINYDKDRNLRIQTETGSKTHSRLIIDNAQVSDSGNYTCHISNADPASTLVYISQGQVTGDKMAAIQRRKSAAVSTLTACDFLYLPFCTPPSLISIVILSLVAF